MNIPAVQHHAGYPDVYLASRKRLVVTIHAAAGDIKTCETDQLLLVCGSGVSFIFS